MYVLRRGALGVVGLALPAVPALAALAPGPATGPLSDALQPAALPVRVDVSLDRPLHSFRPQRAIGAGLDGHSQGEAAQIYTRRNLREMAAAGLGDLTYRLRTELGVEAWHPDPAGRWSEPGRAQGYWTSSARPSRGLRVSWGYALPRRGDTIDQANDAGYSRLDDGSRASFWKSDPYLDSLFTHEPDASHPQWVLVDLGYRRPVDTVRIVWGVPFATRFEVQSYVGSGNAVNPVTGRWTDLTRAALSGRGGTQTVRLAPRPRRIRFLRVLMSASSHTAPAGSRDPRDRAGYAIREVYVGRLGRHGRVLDLINHRASGSQTTTFTSSTDPWHRAGDRDPGYEQPSFQTVLRSGLGHRAPVLVPVPVLYGTPENAVAELRYLQALHVPLRGVELGEEPDGQLAAPEDYGALYVQFARAIHHAFPTLPLGGPGFQTSIPDWVYWPNAQGDVSWMHRFLRYLASRRASARLNFFSFEWYPFDNVCAAPGPQLAEQSQQLTDLLSLQRGHGLPARLPVYIAEYGYSAFAGQDEVDLPGALLNADTVGTLLANGGSAAYLYGYEPDMVMRESSSCDTWGNLALIQSDDQHRARHRLATFWAAQMLTRDWAQPGSGLHTLFATRSDVADAAGHELVRTYTVRRPDGRLALLMLNLSPSQPYQARVRLNGSNQPGGFSASFEEWQLSSATYRWRPDGPAGEPSRDLPPAHRVLSGTASLRLPPYSLTVARTTIPVP